MMNSHSMVSPSASISLFVYSAYIRACDGCSHKHRMRLINVPHSTTNSNKMMMPTTDRIAPMMIEPIIIATNEFMMSPIVEG